MNTPRATPPPTRLQWSGRTDIGKVRANNEDAFLGMLFDGREIHRLGKIGDASTRNADLAFAVCDELFAQIHQALALLGKSYEECEGMETTLSLGWFTPGWFYFGHVGDSRIYYLPKGAKEIKQLTEDDTHIAWLQRHGKISEWEARTHPRRNVLQKSLGGGNQFVDPQVGAVAYEPGDIFLICSDGLVEGLYDHHLVEILRSTAVSAADPGPAHRLVEAALEKDGRDNITALVIQVMAEGG